MKEVPAPGLSRAQYTELTGDSGAAMVPVLTSVLTTVNTPADNATCGKPPRMCNGFAYSAFVFMGVGRGRANVCEAAGLQEADV
jgi:hypothetical protein